MSDASPITAFKAIIDANVPANALLGGRTFADALPESTPLPALTIEQISGAPIHGVREDLDWFEARLQIDVFAANAAQRRIVAAAVRDALKRYRGTIAGITFDDVQLDSMGTGYSPDLDVRRATLDFVAHYYSE